MKRLFFLLISVAGFCMPNDLFAQAGEPSGRRSATLQDTVSGRGTMRIEADTTGQRSNLRIGIQYTSDNIFMGRKDSVAVPYFSPSVYYYHKYGFYAGGSLSYLAAGGNNRIDLYTVTAGYHYTGDNFTGGFSGTKYFFNKGSYNVESQVSGYLHAFAEYDFAHIVTAGATAMLTLTSNPDFFPGLELSHTFYLQNDKISIIPSVSANAGTQQFYNAYYSEVQLRRQRLGAGNGNSAGNQAVSTTTNTIVQNSTSFRMLDYEFALPLHYSSGSFIFSFRPQLDVPVSPADIVINGQTTHESLKPAFFWSAGFSYQF